MSSHNSILCCARKSKSTLAFVFTLVFISQSSIKNTFKSVAAAFFGVQKNSNRKRDFAQGKATHFIMAGIIAVLIFIAVLIMIVNLIVPT
ncbi:DUF2970 domain-containing protein [Colwellia ponticola]|uniref:DUF2970 domain-containing protein n=1 Tax=Colwellia ponticola TaxID=2304625 RepID=A0A8H2PL75_9GAMM|nr:DUF2970 domain-containing protein [Colwellia ponticola]TMM43942.1 DUF2970 domain-containing protein [Colwellia ponticola]